MLHNYIYNKRSIQLIIMSYDKKQWTEWKTKTLAYSLLVTKFWEFYRFWILYFGLSQTQFSLSLSTSPVDNGLNPVWGETCVFDILCPEMALIRFAVMDEDMFGDPNFLGQASFPVKAIRQGTQERTFSFFYLFFFAFFNSFSVTNKYSHGLYALPRSDWRIFSHLI